MVRNREGKVIFVFKYIDCPDIYQEKVRRTVEIVKILNTVWACHMSLISDVTFVGVREP